MPAEAGITTCISPRIASHCVLSQFYRYSESGLSAFFFIPVVVSKAEPDWSASSPSVSALRLELYSKIRRNGFEAYETRSSSSADHTDRIRLQHKRRIHGSAVRPYSGSGSRNYSAAPADGHP